MNKTLNGQHYEFVVSEAGSAVLINLDDALYNGSKRVESRH